MFVHQLEDQFSESWIGPDGGYAIHRYPMTLSGCSRDNVEIVNHLHVIGDEPERNDYDRGGTGFRKFDEAVADVGFKPRLCG